LTIDEGTYDNHKLVAELMAIPAQDKHKKYRDDLADCLRYATALVPWDFAAISPSEYTEKKVSGSPYMQEVPDARWTPKEYAEWEINHRRGLTQQRDAPSEGWREYTDELTNRRRRC
jgi:hypothetical protein